jgi:hypothetical protein
MSDVGLGLPEALERAASAMPEEAEAIRPANGDPVQLLEMLDEAEAARVLTWLLQNEPEAGAELAAEWAEHSRGVGPLQRVEAAVLPKAARKLIRRALHGLRSRGVSVAGASPVPVVAKLPPLDDDLSAAMVSAIDPRGSRIVYLVEAHPSGGARLFEVILDEVRGVVGLEVYTTGRSKARQFLREFIARDRFPAVEAPVEAVRALVARIASTQPADRPLPRGFREWRSRIAPASEDAATPGERAREALGASGDRQALDRAVAFVRDKQLGPWPTDSEALPKFAKRLSEVAQSPIIVSGPARGEQVDGILAEAMEEIFHASACEATAQRFEESAYVSWKRDAEDDARACLEAAREFRERPPRENPVARALIEVLLEPALRKLEEESKGDGDESLLVKPQVSAELTQPPTERKRRAK